MFSHLGIFNSLKCRHFGNKIETCLVGREERRKTKRGQSWEQAWPKKGVSWGCSSQILEDQEPEPLD